MRAKTFHYHYHRSASDWLALAFFIICITAIGAYLYFMAKAVIDFMNSPIIKPRHVVLPVGYKLGKAAWPRIKKQIFGKD